MRYIKVVLLFIIFFFFAIFVVQNHAGLGQNVSFRLDLFVIPPWESIPLPFYVVLLITLLLGAFICVFFLATDRIKISFALHKAQKRINILEQEVASLRAIPLTEKTYKAPAETVSIEVPEARPTGAVPSPAIAKSDDVAVLTEGDNSEIKKQSGENDSDSVAKL